MELVEIARVLDPIFMRNVSNVILDYIRPKDPIITHPNLHKFFVENKLDTNDVDDMYCELESLYIIDNKFSSLMDRKEYGTCSKLFLHENSDVIHTLYNAISIPPKLDIGGGTHFGIICSIVRSKLPEKFLKAFALDIE